MRSISCQFIPLPLIVQDAKKAIVVMENVIGNLGSISRSTQGRRHNLKRGERKLRSKYAMSTNTSSPAVFNASLAACDCSKWQQKQRSNSAANTSLRPALRAMQYPGNFYSVLSDAVDHYKRQGR